MCDIPQGSVLGWVLFNACVSDKNSETESTLSRFADDTKLQGAVNTLEGWDVIQRTWTGLRGGSE